MYLIDTNVLSAIRNKSRCDPRVLRWFSEQWMGDLFVSVMTIRELYFGAYRHEGVDIHLQVELIEWIEKRIIVGFGSHLLDIDAETMRQHAKFKLPNSNISADSLIAATAIRHQLVVATRNTKDFVPLGVRTFNPWDESSG